MDRSQGSGESGSQTRHTITKIKTDRKVLGEGVMCNLSQSIRDRCVRLLKHEEILITEIND